jgi:ABC-type glycerol-3-phosphate transport system permease component
LHSPGPAADRVLFIILVIYIALFLWISIGDWNELLLAMVFLSDDKELRVIN